MFNYPFVDFVFSRRRPSSVFLKIHKRCCVFSWDICHSWASFIIGRHPSRMFSGFTNNAWIISHSWYSFASHYRPSSLLRTDTQCFNQSWVSLAIDHHVTSVQSVTVRQIFSRSPPFYFFSCLADNSWSLPTIQPSCMSKVWQVSQSVATFQVFFCLTNNAWNMATECGPAALQMLTWQPPFKFGLAAALQILSQNS